MSSSAIITSLARFARGAADVEFASIVANAILARLLLEVAYESFQNAGLSTESISGSNTGIFTGQWSYDYNEIQTRDTLAPPLYIVTGTGPATLSNRISYQFNLHGPSLSMNTGCSSSIVALHQAITSLRSGETCMCFVGSANLLLDPHRFVYMSKMKLLSPDVGDPKDASAIAAAFTKNRTSGLPPPVGSVKSNISHTGASSGLAGVIKAVLMPEKKMIPPQASFKTANPDLHLEDRQLRARHIPTKLEKVQFERIFVNNFGYSGTNDHVVIDAVPPLCNTFTSSRSVGHSTGNPGQIFFISAANERSCQRICSRLAQYLVRELRLFPDPNMLLSRLAYTLSMETVHAHRLSLIASNLDESLGQLGEASNDAIIRQDTKQEPRIALVFSGQGAQYAEMGIELLETQPVFTRSMKRASLRLEILGSPWNLLEELRKPKEQSRINEQTVSQPSCTAVQISLVSSLTDLGMAPTAVLGHSSGAIAAAYTSGVISFEDALAISYFRGKLVADVVRRCETPGAMLAFGAEPTIVNERIDAIPKTRGQMKIACFNSLSSATVSGDATAIDELKDTLDKDGVFNRKLSTDGAAYHSYQMELVAKDYENALSTALHKNSGNRS